MKGPNGFGFVSPETVPLRSLLSEAVGMANAPSDLHCASASINVGLSGMARDLKEFEAPVEPTPSSAPEMGQPVAGPGGVGRTGTEPVDGSCIIRVDSTGIHRKT